MSSIIRADKWQNALGVAYNSVLQVVSTTKTDAFTTTSTSYTDVTGLSVTITPKFSNSKMLISYNVCTQGLAGTNMGGLNLLRDSTITVQGDAAGSRTRATTIIPETSGSTAAYSIGTYLDTPATTSAVTYKLQTRTGSAGTIVVNRTNTDTDNAAWFRGISTITVMEIAQ